MELSPAAALAPVPARRSGVRAGLAANVHAVVGLRTSLSDEELRTCGCTHTLADWTELTPELTSSLHALPAPVRRDESPEGS